MTSSRAITRKPIIRRRGLGRVQEGQISCMCRRRISLRLFPSLIHISVGKVPRILKMESLEKGKAPASTPILNLDI